MVDNITIGEKIKVVLSYKKLTVQDLNKMMGYKSPSTLYNKFKRDDFSENDLKEICQKLNCTYDVMIYLEDGKKI